MENEEGLERARARAGRFMERNNTRSGIEGGDLFRLLGARNAPTSVSSDLKPVRVTSLHLLRMHPGMYKLRALHYAGLGTRQESRGPKLR